MNTLVHSWDPWFQQDGPMESATAARHTVPGAASSAVQWQLPDGAAAVPGPLDWESRLVSCSWETPQTVRFWFTSGSVIYSSLTLLFHGKRMATGDGVKEVRRKRGTLSLVFTILEAHTGNWLLAHPAAYLLVDVFRTNLDLTDLVKSSVCSDASETGYKYIFYLNENSVMGRSLGPCLWFPFNWRKETQEEK